MEGEPSAWLVPGVRRGLQMPWWSLLDTLCLPTASGLAVHTSTAVLGSWSSPKAWPGLLAPENAPGLRGPCRGSDSPGAGTCRRPWRGDGIRGKMRTPQSWSQALLSPLPGCSSAPWFPHLQCILPTSESSSSASPILVGNPCPSCFPVCLPLSFLLPLPPFALLPFLGHCPSPTADADRAGQRLLGPTAFSP